MKQQGSINDVESIEQATRTPSGYVLYARGGPSPYPAGALAKNSAVFELNTDRVDLIVTLDRPTKAEIEHFRFGKATFGLYVSGPAIFFLSHFGSMPWSDAPYNVTLYQPHLRGLPEDYAPGKRLLLQLMLIDSSTNRIAALRATTLSPALCEILAKLVKNQLASPVSRAEYDKAISAAYSKHPTPESMRKNAIIACSDHATTKQHKLESGNTQSRPEGNMTCSPQCTSLDVFRFINGITVEGLPFRLGLRYAFGAPEGALPIAALVWYASRDGGGIFRITQLEDGTYERSDGGRAPTIGAILPWVVSDGVIGQQRMCDFV